MSESKVSGFLKESLAPEIAQGFMAPAMTRSFPAVFPLLCAINKAHVVMLARQKLIDAAVARALLHCTLDMEKEGTASVPLDALREEAYFNFEAEVIRRLGPDVGGRMHIARSRNDLKATFDRLRSRNCALAIMEETAALREKLLAAAERFADCVMPGYTHMQPAQPITFGYYLLGIAAGLERDYGRIAGCWERLNRCPMGAGALAGTTFPIDRDDVAALLGFDGPVVHALDAIAGRDTLIELVAASTLLTTTIGRMAQDFYIMTTYEVATLDLPDRVAITSSIMPQKKNMSALENLRGRPAQLAGALMTTLAGFKATSYSHAHDGSTDALRWVWDALDEVALALPVASLIVETAQPRRERMLDLARKNYSTATDLADALVRVGGLSFRDALQVVGRVVRLALEEGRSADQIDAALVERAGLEVLGKPVTLDASVVRDAVDPARAVESRRNTGGPSQHDIAQMLEASLARLANDRETLRRRHDGVAAAEQKLDEAVESHLAEGTA
ncbi:MAG: argininosuccinate lyase [Variibacter sp.]